MILLKVLCFYLVTIAIMRLMGKSTINQMTPYDLVAIIIVGTVASEPLASTKFWQTLLTLGILVGLHIVFSYMSLNQWAHRFFLGEPTLLIKHGKILEDNLEKSQLSVAQILSILRSKGYPKIADVDYAVLEPIGKVSVIPKPENTPTTVEHLNVTIDDQGLPIAVIIDGKIQNKNLKLLGTSKEWLIERLKEEGHKPKDIIYAFVTEKSKKLNINPRSKAKQ